MNERQITIVKKDDRPPKRHARLEYLLRDFDSLLHTMIEIDLDRAKEIIEKIDASNRQKAA